MFIPIGDYPNPPGKAVVTWSLIAINVVVFVLVSLPMNRGLTREDLQDPEILQQLNEMWTAFEHANAGFQIDKRAWLLSRTRYDLFVHQYGYIPGKPSFVALLFCMFLHGGFMHLAGNMLYLWIYGDNVEHRLGKVGYLVAYLATGMIATLSFAMMSGESMIPLVGASGAISGVLGFYLIWFPRNYVKMFIWLGLFFADTIHIPAVFVLLFYVVVDNILPLISGGTSAVAYGAHLGGFVAGVAAAFLLRNTTGPTQVESRVRVIRPRPRNW